MVDHRSARQAIHATTLLEKIEECSNARERAEGTLLAMAEGIASESAAGLEIQEAVHTYARTVALELLHHQLRESLLGYDLAKLQAAFYRAAIERATEGTAFYEDESASLK